MFEDFIFDLRHPSRVDIDNYQHCAISGKLLPFHLCDECEFKEGWLDVWELLVSGGGRFYPNYQNGMLMCEGAFQRAYILADEFDMEKAEQLVATMYEAAKKIDKREGRIFPNDEQTKSLAGLMETQ